METTTLLSVIRLVNSILLSLSVIGIALLYQHLQKPGYMLHWWYKIWGMFIPGSLNAIILVVKEMPAFLKIIWKRENSPLIWLYHRMIDLCTFFNIIIYCYCITPINNGVGIV